jgi:hypothetical protein
MTHLKTSSSFRNEKCSKEIIGYLYTLYSSSSSNGYIDASRKGESTMRLKGQIQGSPISYRKLNQMFVHVDWLTSARSHPEEHLAPELILRYTNVCGRLSYKGRTAPNRASSSDLALWCGDTHLQD